MTIIVFMLFYYIHPVPVKSN